MENATTPTHEGDELASFREQWKKELEKDSQVTAEEEDGVEDQEDDKHKQAREFFLHGVHLEQTGKLYDAIRFYKKAVALVPDIEHQAFLYFGGNKKTEHVNTNLESSKNQDENGNPDSDTSNSLEMVNLLGKFSRLGLANSRTIQPEIPTQSTHIGELPTEVLNYILKWVVSAELDLKSLENCALVSRGFYIAARDEEIWRLICSRVWGASVSANNYYSKWRELFLTRPRVNFNGTYNSRISYIREGERNFQDHESYKSWHIVSYFRFLRFFPGGRCLMAISADDPGLTAKLMNNRKVCSVQGAMFGDYRIVENVLVVVLHQAVNTKKNTQTRFRKKKKEASISYYEPPEQDFHLEFYIKGNENQHLHWKNYNIVSKYKSGRETVDVMNVADGNYYPKLDFNEVGSYHFESNSPLKF